MTTTDVPTTAEGLPVLARGRHPRPEEGACLLEYTSVLAGRRFSDHPRCIAPVLATLGRLVNDAMSDEARHEVARLAPDLAVRPRVTPGATASLVAHVLSEVASAVGASSDVRARRTARWLAANAGCEARRGRAASRRLGSAWVRSTAVAHRCGIARLRLEYAVRATASLPPEDRDRLLIRLLETATVAVPARRPARATTTAEFHSVIGGDQPSRTRQRA